MKKLAIIGSGDLGRLIAHHAQLLGYSVAGFIDDFQAVGANVEQVPVLGKIDEVESLFKNGAFDLLMCGIGYRHMDFRESVFNRFSPAIPFAKLIHASTIIDPTVKTGAGIFVLPGCTLDHNVVLGNNVLLNTGCTIAHDSRVEDHSFLSPAVKIAGFSQVGKKCVIGIGTTIIDNITIANEIQTGAGAVVTTNLESSGLYVGLPARLKRSFT